MKMFCFEINLKLVFEATKPKTTRKEMCEGERKREGRGGEGREEERGMGEGGEGEKERGGKRERGGRREEMNTLTTIH